MAKTFNDVITLMRRIIGENDGNDPDATQAILLGYVGNFYSLIMGQEIKSHDIYTDWEFDTVIDQDTYTFKGQGFTNILPPAYVIDSQNSDTRLNWIQNRELFYKRHPIRDDNEDHSRPNDILFANDEIIIRPKPDQVYTIRVKAYKEFTIPTDGTTNIDQDYMIRFIAYGSALDYLADFGNIEDYAKIEPIYKRYKALVLMRKAKQETTQRAKPAL